MMADLGADYGLLRLKPFFVQLGEDLGQDKNPARKTNLLKKMD